MTASERVREEWARRVMAEYRSASYTQHLTLWLLQIAASPDLVRDGLRIVDDELVHAELSFATLVAAGGAMPGPIPRETLALPTPTGPLEHAVLHHGVEIFCLGETVAVRLFNQLRARATAPAARGALDRVLKDEVRHRDFGWTLLAWLLERDPSLAERVQAELPAMGERVWASYGRVAGDTLDPEDEAWGLMAPARYRAVLEETIERDYIPRFASFGIEGACLRGDA